MAMPRDEHGNKVSSTRPVDDVVADLIERIGNKGRGFVLGLNKEEGGKTVIEVKESLPPHDEWMPPANYRQHKIENTDSFIAYAMRYGKAEQSLVFYNESKATLSIDEQVAIGDRELVTMEFIESADWKEWSAVVNANAKTPLSHRDLLRFLMTHAHNLVEPAVLQSMQAIKLNSTVNIESDIREDEKTIGLFIKSSAGEELKKFPKAFDIHIAVLDQDSTDEEKEMLATIRLDVQLPDDPKSLPTFALICSVWRQLKRKRIADEGQEIANGLPGWTVVHGSHSTVPRKLGQK